MTQLSKKAALAVVSGVLAVGCGLGDELLFGRYLDPRSGYCDASSPPCPDGQFCNVVKSQCEQGACSEQDRVGCSEPSAAHCQQSHCLPCQSNSDCERWSATYGMGAAKEVCDQGACRPCAANAECSSSLCRTSDLTVGSDGKNAGSCVPTSDITYVSNAASPLSCADRTGSREAPFCEIGAALASGHSVLLVLGSSKVYLPFAVSQGSVTVIGPGRDLSPSAMIAGAQVTGSAQLLMRDLWLTPSSGMTAARCEGAQLVMRKVNIQSADLSQRGAHGVEARGCGQLELEESMVDGFNGAGVVVESGAYRLVNNVVTRNGIAADPYGVSLGNLTSGTFLFNTVVANGRGVLCASQNPLTASVVSDNLGRLDEQVQGNCKVTDVATRVYDLLAADKATVTPDRLKLQRFFLLHQQCCIDRIDPAALQPSVVRDYFGRSRPKGIAADIGFHESD